MPRIELRDAVNTVYRIDTSDWLRVADWLTEWLPRLRAPSIALSMMIYPLWPEGAAGFPDWNADSRFFRPFVIPDESADAVMRAIELERKFIERAKAETIRE